MLFNIITNYSPGYVEGVLANVSRALSSCALCALLPMGISLPVLLGLHPDDCHGGPYLNTTIHTTTKSYIISYLSSYMILLGFHWKLWVVWVMVFWVGGMGW